MRTLAAVLLLVVLTLPPSAAAQPVKKTPRVGLLLLGSATSGAGAATIEALRASLRDLGYVEGRTIVIDIRSAEGRAERLPALAAELVERKADVIVTGVGNVSTIAARNATSTVPIVMGGSLGAVGSGLVASLARPGGNVTGLTVPEELGAKQIELLRELIPSLSRVIVLTRAGLATQDKLARSKALALEFLRVTVDYVQVQECEDLGKAFIAVRAARPHATIVGPDALFFQARDEIVEFARTARLPAIYPYRDFVEAGGLMSYSLGPEEAAQGIARYVDRILKGAKPADLPVEEPTKYELVINARTARGIGLTIPPALRLRANHVLE